MSILPKKPTAVSANKMKILFICSANICRSPTAEGIMRQLCPEAQIDSAGLCAYEGDAPDIYAVTCAARHGIDISGLRSRPVRADDFAVFDRILAMDADGAGYLELRRPQGDKRYLKAKIENLAAYAGVSQIPNPYGTDGFEAVYDLIEKACRNLAAKIQENLASNAL